MEEKRQSHLGYEAVPQNALPVPSTTSRSTAKNGSIKRLFSILLIAGCTAFWLIRTNPSEHVTEITSALPNSISSYFDGIANRGSKFAVLGDLKSHKHKDKHGKHHKSKHGHKDKHGHKGKHGGHGHGGDHHGPRRPGPFITPKKAEEIFLSVPNNDSARAALRLYTSNAHPAGSGFDFITALQVKNEWENALGLPSTGAEENVYDAGDSESQDRIKNGMSKMGVWIDTYFPVMNTPVTSSVTLMTDPPFKAKLQEDIVEGDPDSIHRDDVRVFHGLSVSGDVTGKVVYAGKGRKADFLLLEEKGVSLKGKIALVSYGGVFRGLKVKAAQEAGALGCLIFTDPGDDGEITEENGYEAYPDGPARQPSSVQRGSVQFLSVYPGDPTTPGEPAYKNASRLEGGNQPSIPSLPISYEDAIPILKSLEGNGHHAKDLKADWVGGLGYHGVDYWTGPSEVDLHFVNEVNTRVMPIWNTMATIPGYITDEVIVIGNHRDAWVMGASDPNSGSATLHETVKGLGELVKKGWKPLRTILLASWDAEEYGLIGSTEWTEDFGDWLETDAAAYLNLDSSVSGSIFGAQSSPSLAWLTRKAAENVLTSLDGTQSVWDSRREEDDWKAWRIQQFGADELDTDYEELFSSETGVGSLGSGSDYTAFLQRYGVASSNFGFGGGPKDAAYHYHSIYDSFNWMDKFADPGFHRHTDAAKVLGLMALRLADSLILPLNTTQYAVELESYLAKVQRIADDMEYSSQIDLEKLGEAIKGLIGESQSLDEQKHEAIKKLIGLLPKPKTHCCGLFEFAARFWARVQAIFGVKQEYVQSVDVVTPEQMDVWGETLKSHSHPHRPRLPEKKQKEIKKVLEEIRGINKKLQAFEGGFISEEGLKEREWYKHKGVAPGLWLGYGSTTFPGLTEALTIDHSPELAQKEADELTEMIEAMGKRLSA